MTKKILRAVLDGWMDGLDRSLWTVTTSRASVAFKSDEWYSCQVGNAIEGNITKRKC